MWIERPELPLRCKLRIFKSRKEGIWFLVFPATPKMKSKRKAVRFPEWITAWNAAMAIQDMRNRNSS